MSTARISARSLYLLLLLGTLPSLGAGKLQTEDSQFADRVAPLLAAHCLECHSGSDPEGELDLSRSESVRTGGSSGPAVVAGDLQASVLWQRIVADEMPPKHPLGEQEKRVLRDWIEAGANWTGGPIDRFAYTTDARAGYDWWSLQALKDPPLPPIARTGWVREPLDRFVLAKLEAAGLEPSPEAEPPVLLRRLFLDLWGLAPTPEDLDAFAADCRVGGVDRAYARQVDRLLASPRYGERWGRHWLDVVRYGESDGFERNNPRKNLWPYRDWVIRAFNTDMPYRKFVQWQVAGDLLQPGESGAAAAGFLVAGVHNTVVGSSERMKRLARQDELEEMIGTLGQTFLGLTVHCARCHDHKFDPIASRDYYRMIAAIDGVEHGERPVPREEVARELADVQRTLTGLRERYDAIAEPVRQTLLQERHEQPLAVDLPVPLASWDFEQDARDGHGELHGELKGAARIAEGALVLDGRDAYLQTPPLRVTLKAKTLEAWVRLDGLDQRGGGVISVQSLDGNVFDAVVFGEQEPRRWMAGSEFFRRTRSFQGTDEMDAGERPVHVAIVYALDGTVTAYRDGQPYGTPYATDLRQFAAGESQVVLGLRHAPVGGNKMLSGRVLQARLYDRALSPEAVAASAGRSSDYVSEEALLARLDLDQRQELIELARRRATAEARRDALQEQARLPLYTVLSRQPPAMQIHRRGSVSELGAIVTPGGIAGLGTSDPEFGLPPAAADADRRKALAGWLADAGNPLPPRVIVNRVWHYHFGRGIVETPNDLGFNGGRPSHPELLDYLAVRLRENGFHLKDLHRGIVMSATYRQSSARRARPAEVDADNRLLWRYAPRRIEAEVLRDTMLQAAGILNLEMGGPGFEDVRIDVNDGTTYYEPFPAVGPEFDRRTVYRFSPRGGRSAVLDTFDCPDPSTAAPRRNVTTTPLQALALLNNPFVLRIADQLADRVIREAPTRLDERITLAWQLTVGRRPDAYELQQSRKLAEERGLPALCRGLLNCSEYVVVK